MDSLFGFIDGENIVTRYQSMIAEGAIPASGVVRHPDLLIWHPSVTGRFLVDIKRISYCQTAVGDHSRIDEIRGIISQASYKYSMGQNMGGAGRLIPRVFKKEGRSSKSKSVDINITVDMMRHSITM